MERKVKDLSKERDKLLRQIDSEDRQHSKNSSMNRSSNLNSQMQSTQSMSKISSSKNIVIQDERYRSNKERQSLKKIDNNVSNNNDYYSKGGNQTQKITFHSRSKLSEDITIPNSNDMKSKMKEVSGRLRLLQEQEEELKQ